MAALLTIADYWRTVVEKDVEEFLASPADLRKAMHVAVSLFQMKDWGVHSGLWRNSIGPFIARCPEFKYIRDTCNALKHLKLDASRSTAMSGAQDVHQQRGVFDSGIFDSGIFATAKVTLDAGPDGVHEFAPLVQAVYRMWQQELISRGILEG